MSVFDEQYIDLCRRILDHGEKIVNYKKKNEHQNPKDQNRKNISPLPKTSSSNSTAIPDHVSQASSEAKTLRLPHEILKFDLKKEFPILTSKKVGFKSAVLEILWIYQVASNDVRWLQDRNVKIWNEWEISESGEYQGRNINELFKKNHPTENPENFAHTIGTAYGWIVNKYSLIENLIETLKTNPGNRRMVLSLWQNEWIETAALPSCVWNSQWNLIDGKLNLLVTSRSTDVPLGLPYNIVQYAVLCHLIARTVGAKPGQFTFITNDAHIYENQIPGIKEQIKRYDEAIKNKTLPAPPKLWINPEIKDFYDFDNSRELKDTRLEGYEHLGAIKMPVTE